MKTPLISIITVNFNGKNYLEKCLSSVFNLNYPETRLEVILVDNLSSDDSLSLVNERFPRVKVLKNKINNYCKANNLAIKESSGEYVLLMNNDVYLNRNWLKETLSLLSTRSDAAACMGKILFPDKRIQSAGHYELPNFYWADRGFKEKDIGQFGNIEEISSIPNTAVIYRRNVFKNVGYFDEDFNMYLEDVDFSYRCKKYGYKLLYVPSAVCVHEFHGVASEEFIMNQIERNRLLFIAKHFPEKLAANIFGPGLSTLGHSRMNSAKIIKYLPCAIEKLFLTQKKEFLRNVIPGVITALKEVIDYEKYSLAQENYNFEKEVDKSKKECLNIQEKVQNLENYVFELEEKIKNISFQNENLIMSLGNIKVLESEIAAKEEDLRNKIDELQKITIQLNETQAAFNNLKEELRRKQEEFNLKDKESQEKEILLSELRGKSSSLEGIVQSDRHELKDLAARASKLETELSREKETLVNITAQADRLKQELEINTKEVSRLDEEIKRKESQLLNIIDEKDILTSKLLELGNNQNAFYSSRTFRFIIKPFWRFLDFVKMFKKTKVLKIAVIKPYIVPKEDFISFIDKLKFENPGACISGIISADSGSKSDYLNSNIEKYLFSFKDKRFNPLIFIFKFIFLAIFNKFDIIYVLESQAMPCGYRKARILAVLLSARMVKIHYLYHNKEEAQGNIVKLFFRFIFSRISLYFIALLFIFIALWVKIKKFLLCFKKSI